MNQADRVHDESEARRYEALGRSATGLAHDLAKPLMVVEHLASRLFDRPHDADGLRRDAATLHALAREMLDSVRSFVTRARGTGGREEHGELAWIAERAIARVRMAFPDSRIVVKADASAARTRHSRALVSAVANLLDNALRASARSRPVTLRLSRVTGEDRIDVVDTGSGMSEAVAARAFEPFFSMRADGTGIGLAVVQDVVEELGGSVEIASAPGSGTRARIRLPSES